jgi:hypothetical protein
MKIRLKAIYISHRLVPLRLIVRLMDVISHSSIIKYLGVIFDNRIIWRLHVDMIEAKAFRTFITIDSLFKNESLSTDIKLNVHKALIRSVVNRTCPAWESAADTYILKLQHLQNKVLQTTGDFPSAYQSAICTWLSTFHMYTVI